MQMSRSVFLGLLGVLLFGSLHGTTSSQPHYTTPSSHSTGKTTDIHPTVDDDFVPDTLPIEDDDAEEQLAQQSVKRNIRRMKKAVSSKGASDSFKPSHPQRGRVDKNVNGHRRLLQNTGQVLDVTARTSTARNNDLVPQVASPQGKLPLQPSRPFNSKPLVEQHRQNSAAKEEEQLRITTRKLVKWLRNRLRKRLEEVASLEEKSDVEEKLLTRLNETIMAEASGRQAEIRKKLQTQSELKDVRRHFREPDRELTEVRAVNSHLVDQLALLKKTYNDLAATRKQMEDKLVSAGFTYWLDKRGKEYMPATAVGVLSKSAKILDPVSRGLEEVVRLDKLFTTGVGSMIPISPRSLISKILRDLALLLPMIPVVMLLWRVSQISQRVSILHLVMYISAIFAIQSSLMFVFSVCIGAEAIREIQRSHELFVFTGVFVDVLLFIVLIGIQILLMALRTSKSEVMQSLMSLAVGYHFFRTVFQPVVVSQPSTTTLAAHAMYAINFTVIAFEKKATLKVGTRLDKHLNSFLLSVESWFSETFQAMKELFEDTLPDVSGDDTFNTEEHTLSSHNALLRELDPASDHVSLRKEANVEEIAKALNASRGYARWTAGRTRDRDTHGTGVRPAFRGIRWNEANPQLALLQSGSRRRAKLGPTSLGRTTSEHPSPPKK